MLVCSRSVWFLSGCCWCWWVCWSSEVLSSASGVEAQIRRCTCKCYSHRCHRLWVQGAQPPSTHNILALALIQPWAPNGVFRLIQNC